MNDDIAEAKRLLPLPQLMERCGLGEHAKKSARCPFHEDGSNSFSVWQGDKGWQFKCHAGCGNGDEITFLELHEKLANADATKRFLEMSGLRGERTNGAKRKPSGAVKSFDWRKCADAFTEADAANLATWRGYSVPFVQWLRERALVGKFGECIAFPVHNEAGAAIGAHYRLEADGSWRFEPKGCRVCPLVIGELATARRVHAFESQWDMFAACDKLDGHTTPGFAFLATRGAENGGLVSGLIRADAEVFAWVQNDADEKRNAKTGLTPADKWQATVAGNAGCKVRSVATPAGHKDANDWTRAGADADALMAAISAARVFTATPQASEGADWLAAFNAGTVSAAELHTMELPHHALLLDKWFAEADLGFVFAARGIGKTHLCLGLARALAEGSCIGPWRACGAVPVLYVDGEMNAEQIRARDAGLATRDSLLHYINHEVLFERTEKTLNLAQREQQDALTALCVARGVRVLFLDNLSVLFSGIEENDNFAWEAVLPWLLRLRKLNIAVVIVAHAGRNGHMRGASKREDSAAWVLRLDDALDAATVKRGAKFVTTFTKPSRHTPAEMPAYEWQFAPEEVTGRCAVTYREASGLEVFLQWVGDGLQTCGEIAEEMHTSKGTVSKLAKRAETAGRIRIDSRKYILTDGNEDHEK